MIESAATLASLARRDRDADVLALIDIARVDLGMRLDDGAETVLSPSEWCRIVAIYDLASVAASPPRARAPQVAHRLPCPGVLDIDTAATFRLGIDRMLAAVALSERRLVAGIRAAMSHENAPDVAAAVVAAGKRYEAVLRALRADFLDLLEIVEAAIEGGADSPKSPVASRSDEVCAVGPASSRCEQRTAAPRAEPTSARLR
jgi:hypothetical protein